jgi:hypothetical protein
MSKQAGITTDFHGLEGTTAVGIKLSGAGAVTLVTKVRGYDLDNDLVVLQVMVWIPNLSSSATRTRWPLGK